MAEIPEEEVQEEDAPPRKAGMILPILLAVLASGIGGTVGMTLMGPSVGSWMAAKASEDGGRKKSASGGGSHGGGGGYPLTTSSRTSWSTPPAQRATGTSW